MNASTDRGFIQLADESRVQGLWPVPSPDRCQPRGADFRLAHDGIGRGYMRVDHDDDCLLTFADAVLNVRKQLSMRTTRDLLFVRAVRSSRGCYRFTAGPTWGSIVDRVTVAVVPRDTRFEVVIDAGVPQRAFTMWADVQRLLARFGASAHELPAPLRDIVVGPCEQLRQVLDMPVTAEIAALIDDLAHSRLEGAMRRLQLQARGAELFALVASQWPAREAELQPLGLRGRDAALLVAARRLLAERCTEPPTLPELARKLGTNKNKLNQLFRAHVGMTPAAFANGLRMERARALLAEGRLNVSQIADACGYSHHSTFATAFKAAVGLPPRDYATQLRKGLRSSFH